MTGAGLCFPGQLILQAPASVFEGDTLVLRCGVRRGEKLGTVTYSWNGKVVSSSPEARDLAIPQASLNNSGFYGCTGFLQGNRYSYRSSARYVNIQGTPFVSCRLLRHVRAGRA